MRRALLACAPALLVAACATYRPAPLDLNPTLPSDPAQVRVVARDMPLPELAAHRFDPADGLDMTEVAMLAVANNPQLKVARATAGVTRAQAFAAGLLPDPQLSLTRDFPTNGGPSNTSAFNLGLSYDVNQLLSHSAKKSAARAQARQADLGLLWQEWQVVSQARLSFVRLTEGARLLRVLREERALARTRYVRRQAAVAVGDITRVTLDIDLAALQKLDKAVNDAERKLTAERYAFNALLGLAPTARLKLVGNADAPPIDVARIRSELPRLARRRPDLRALIQGYRSQEARFRAAILQQFPTLNVGFTRARDTSDIYTTGFGITLSLPILNGNRGNVAIERATRARLRAEFETRLLAAKAEIERILDDQALLRAQRENVARGIDALARTVKAADAAYQARDIDEVAYTDLRTAWLEKRAEAIAIDQALLEHRAALQTLVGTRLPAPSKQSRHANHDTPNP